MSGLDLTDNRHVAIGMQLTQTRRRMLNDLIGIRKCRRILRSDLAEAIGVSVSELAEFEDNLDLADPTFDFLLRYAHVVEAVIEMRVIPGWATDA